MFKEDEHPRAEDGKFTDKDGGKKGYDSRDDLGGIRNAKEDTVQPSLEEVLGQEFEGYKGQAAVEKLMQEKHGHVKGAFHRDDIGDIDLLWGNDYLGLQHIIAHREEQGINVGEFLSDLAEVVDKGIFKKKNNRGNFEFVHDRKMVIIAPEYNGNKITYVLTAYKTRAQKKPPQ